MPSAPKTHATKSIGKSHGSEVKRKKINKQAWTRQKARKYATNSKQWAAIRTTHIQAHEDNTLCRMCLDEGFYVPMTDVDHIDGDTYNNKPNNLQSLCKSCHSSKTAKEDGGFGNKI